MGKYLNRTSAQTGSLVGLQFEMENNNRLLADILVELRESNRLTRMQMGIPPLAPAGPPPMLAHR